MRKIVYLSVVVVTAEQMIINYQNDRRDTRNAAELFNYCLF